MMTIHAETAGKEERHLGVPVVGSQRPAMRKYNRLTGTPVFLEYGDAIFSRNCVHLHLSGLL